MIRTTNSGNVVVHGLPTARPRISAEEQLKTFGIGVGIGTGSAVLNGGQSAAFVQRAGYQRWLNRRSAGRGVVAPSTTNPVRTIQPHWN